jgi:hypothetical protein
MCAHAIAYLLYQLSYPSSQNGLFHVSNTVLLLLRIFIEGFMWSVSRSSWTDSIPKYTLPLLLSPFKIVPFQVYAMVLVLLPLLQTLLELTFELLVGCPVIFPDFFIERAAVLFLCH